VVIHLLSQPPHLKEQEQENAKSIMDSMWRASWLEQHALSSNTGPRMNVVEEAETWGARAGVDFNTARVTPTYSTTKRVIRRSKP